MYCHDTITLVKKEKKMTIKEALEQGIKRLKQQEIEEPIRKARIVMSYLLKVPKEQLVVIENNVLEQEEKWEEAIRKLEKQVPIQYIIHHQEFMKLDFYVDENVLIPQPDTEILVEEVLKLAQDKAPKILDLCTGSGCIAISIAKNLPKSKVTGLDISKEALEVAKENAKKKEVDVEWIWSDLWELLPEEKWNIIVSNPPYIETEVLKTLSKEVQKEPVLALDGGQDGLAIYRRIIEKAHEYLEEKGWLCLEIGYQQKEKVMQLLKEKGNYEEAISKKDLAGNDRVVMARKK